MDVTGVIFTHLGTVAKVETADFRLISPHMSGGYAQGYTLNPQVTGG